MDKKRNRKLINWLGLTGIVALLSYASAVVFSPLAYPGYNWMAQAVSDLSAETAPSRMLWNQLAALYGKCSLVSVTCVSIFISEKKISTKLFRIGVYLFAVMNWISGVGYTMFPLADSGKEIASFQEVMHMVVTVLVVLLSIISLIRIPKRRTAWNRYSGCGRIVHDDGRCNRTGRCFATVLWHRGTFQCVCRRRV